MQKFVGIKKFLKQEDGASMAEYAVLMAIMTGAVVTALTLLGNNIGNLLTKVANFIGTIQINGA